MRIDALPIIEACYAVDLPEVDWLAGLCAAARPSLDNGLGVVALTFHVSPAGVASNAIATLGVSEDLLTAAYRVVPDTRMVAKAYDAPCTTVLAAIGNVLRRRRSWTELGRIHGVRDSLGVFGRNPDGRGAALATYLRAELRTSPALAARGARLAAHLAAAYRLRRRLATPPQRQSDGRVPVSLDGVEAILTPRGTVEHAAPPAEGRRERERLRTAAIAVDRARGPLRRRDPEAAVALWTALVDGRWSLVDHFDTDGRRFLIAHRNDPCVPAHAGLTTRERLALAFRAQGHSLKLIAYELGLAVSMVARDIARGSAKLGLRGQADLVQLFTTGAGETSPPSAEPSRR